MALLLQQWAAAYRLSKMWDFEEIRPRSERALKAIMLSRPYEEAADTVHLHYDLGLDLDNAFLMAVQTSVTKSVELTEEKIKLVGFEAVKKIYWTERWAVGGSSSKVPLARRVRSVELGASNILLCRPI